VNEQTTAHIYIFASVIALISGVVTLLAALRAREGRREEFFGPLIGYLLVYNLYLLIGFTNIYTAANVFGGLTTHEHTTFTLVLSAITHLAVVGMAWTLFRFALRLGAAGENRQLRIAGDSLLAGLAVLMTATGVASELFRPPPGWLTILLMLLSPLLFLAFVLPPAVLLWRCRKNPEGSAEIRRIRSYGLTYAMIFVFMFGVGVLPTGLRIVAAVMLLPALNLGLYVWLRRFMPALPAGENGSGNGSVTIDDPALLDTFCARYELSRREREIAELIVKGRSNKEIEDELFISIHTVKNHIYRLYRKIGVNSRGQLMSRLVEEQKSWNGVAAGTMAGETVAEADHS